MSYSDLIIASVGGLLLLAVLLLLTRRGVLRKISRLNKQLSRITSEGRFDQRLPVTGEGAIAGLGTNLNRLLSTLADKDKRVREREDLFKKLAESVHEAIVIHRDHIIIYANAKAAALRGVRQQDLVGRPITDLVHPAFRDEVLENTRRRLSGDDTPDTYEVQLLDRSGDGIWVEASGALIDYMGESAVLATAFDIRHQKTMQEALDRGREQAQITLESIGEGVITTDADGRIDYVNSGAAELMGTTPEAARGRRLGELVSLVDEIDRKSLGDPVQRCLEERKRINLGRRALLVTKGSDEECSVEVTASPIRHAGEITGAVVVLHDVTELRGMTRQISYQASHDPLTGLFNRREFERRLEDALASAHTGDASHVLWYLDLDRFKVINDTCGHIAGDNVLREVAGLIKEKVRDSDSVARIGGDECGMLLIGCPLEKARQISDDVCAAIRDYRFVWRDRIFNIGVSIGLVEIGHESGGVEDVLSAADSACYVAKQQGRGRVHVYSARDEAIARHRGEIQWLQRLQNALKDNRFELYGQPIRPLDTAEGGPALEILLRMRDESGVEYSPEEFMRAAERYNLMPAVDRWVVQASFAALGSGALRLPPDRGITINLSGQTLGDPGFLEFVVECFDHTGVVADQVCFEVTESSVLSNIKHARRFIAVLHGMGCRFALDDFGSGLGSFSSLKNLAMDFLKIDGSLIRNLDTDSVNQAMVAAMIKLARTLGIDVIAEQVEDANALAAVRDMGADYAQGYVLGRPEPLQTAH